MIFSTAITHRSEIEDDMDGECSVGSLTAVQGQLTKTNSSVTNESGVDIDSDDIMTRLNKKIHNLFLDWEHRRETTKERNNKEKKKLSKPQDDESMSTSSKATPTTSPFVAQVKSSCYKKKNGDGDSDRGDTHSTFFPYPSQIRILASLSTSRLDD